MLTVIMMVVALAGVAEAADGAALYKAKLCGACHGPGRKAGDLKTSAMNGPTMLQFLRDPKSVLPKATMPATQGTDAELAAIVDYVKSFK